ncbi:dynein regulatory complex protein 9 [Lampris incognitus]|uniref:dynein regulatory complex protein 9 n=1 Tax=Lampris incognitus TaxID=2546036 RepID=UPI0024B598F1|nr:dynein regulatory complex protein 9 [Lampris incognitus]
MSSRLSCVEALRLRAVLEDCSHQLAVLGNVMPQRSRSCSQADEDHTMDHMDKIQRDREFAVGVIDSLLAELKEQQTVQCLLEAVEAEHRRKAHVQQVISREEEAERKIATLQKELQDVRRETQRELQRRQELVAELERRLLEMNEKTSAEKSYIHSSTQQQIHQTQKLNSHNEKSLEDQIKRLHLQMEEAQRVHQKTDRFLKEKLKVREEQLEERKERYRTRLEEKESELQAMTSSRTSTRSALQERARKV